MSLWSTIGEGAKLYGDGLTLITSGAGHGAAACPALHGRVVVVNDVVDTNVVVEIGQYTAWSSQQSPVA
jgi:hypothetical protein